MAEFDREDFEKRLVAIAERDGSTDALVAIAVRAAMRVLPFVALARDADFYRDAPIGMRGILTAGVAAFTPSAPLRAAAYAAVRAAARADDTYVEVASADAAADAAANAAARAACAALADVGALTALADAAAACAAGLADNASIYAAFAAARAAAARASASVSADADTAASAAAAASAEAARAASADAAAAAVSAAYAGSVADLHFAESAVAQDSFFGRLLGGSRGRDASAVEIMARPIWPEGAPKWFAREHANWRRELLGLSPELAVLADWYAARVEGWPRLEPWEEEWALLSDEQWAQEPDALGRTLSGFRDRHLAAAASGVAVETAQLRRVRAIFLGPGGAGKTSLIRVLHGEEPTEDYQVTKGVAEHQSRHELAGDLFTKLDEIEAVARVEEDAEQKITVHYWDFGGQFMTHATHQFFLRASCVYVIVLDARLTDDATPEAEYWLGFVRAVADARTPVLVVGNKAETSDIHLNIAALKRKHDQVLGFYPLSCRRAKTEMKPEFERFRRDFAKALGDMAETGARFSPAEFRVLERAREMSKSQALLTEAEFNKMCRDEGLSDARAGDMLDLFYKLGVVLHFENLPTLDGYVLNPRWLTFGVYAILYAKQTTAAGGRISRKDVVEILKQATLTREDGSALSYSAADAGVIIDAMKAFKTAYELPSGDGDLVVPALLPVDEPDHGLNLNESLAFRFAFADFLPPQLLPAMIVGRSHEIADSGKRVWRNGAVFHAKEARAMVVASRQARRLELFVEGPRAEDYLGVLRDLAAAALAPMSGLAYDERLRLSPEMATDAAEPSFGHDDEVWADFDMIEAASRRKDLAVPVGKKLYVLDRIMRRAPTASIDRHGDVFLSYAHKNRPLVEALAKLLDSGGASNWWDMHLRAGDEWWPQLGDKIDKAKALCVIWTAESLRSKVVAEEVARAGGKVIDLLGPNTKPEDLPEARRKLHLISWDDQAALAKALAGKGVTMRKVERARWL